MNIDFTSEELLFIYGHFKIEAQKLEKIKSAPDCPLDSSDLTSRINLYNSIATKISDYEPNLLNMDPYLAKVKNN